jgi:hypothetical protein
MERPHVASTVRELVERLDGSAAIEDGRLDIADPEQLGEYVLVDYVSRRSSRVA